MCEIVIDGVSSRKDGVKLRSWCGLVSARAQVALRRLPFCELLTEGQVTHDKDHQQSYSKRLDAVSGAQLTMVRLCTAIKALISSSVTLIPMLTCAWLSNFGT